MAVEPRKDTENPIFIDYSHEVQLSGSPMLRGILKGLALIFLLLGLIGIFLPILPTTPFILLASACFAKSSVRFYNWLMNHRVLGPPLRTWKLKGAISRKNKTIAVSMIAISAFSTIIFWIPLLFAKIVVGLVCATVGLFIWTRPES